MFSSDHGYSNWEQCLKDQLEELIHAVTAFEFARNDAIIERVECAQQRVDTHLHSFIGSQLVAECDEASSEQISLELLVVEAHQLLARSRTLLAPYRRPRLVARDGLTIEQRHTHADLTDAEFERLLAASDIPVFGVGGYCAGGFEGSDHRWESPSDNVSNRDDSDKVVLTLVSNTSLLDSPSTNDDKC